MDIQLNEVFDENTLTYPVFNLKPNLKLPQVWKFDVPGNDKLMARMVSFQSDGDAVKNVKMGDKFVQVFLLSMSEKGNPSELRNGLGSDPIGAITTIFDTIAAQVKQYRFDAVLFRLPIKKMKGQGPAVQRILSRLAQTRTGGKFVVLKELWAHSNKFSYVLIRRKNVQLEDIKGLPAISSELFTTVKTQVGDTYVCKKTGQAVTKDEAFAASIAAVEDNRTTDRAIAAKTKISRREAIASQYSNIQNLDGWRPERIAIKDKLNANLPDVSTTADQAINTNVSTITKESVQAVKNNLVPVIPVDQFVALEDFERLDIVSSENLDKIIRVKRRIKNIEQQTAHLTPRQDDEVTRDAVNLINSINEITKDYNGKNHVEIYKRISNLATDSYYLDKISSNELHDFIQLTIDELTSDISSSNTVLYRALGSEFAKNVSSDERDVLKGYCGKMYNDVNEFLNGVEEAPAVIYEKYIPTLDKIFEKGYKLPSNTPLFRGMSLTQDQFEKVVQNKIFYFANYVSTSLSPAFAGMYGNSVTALNSNASKEIDLDAGEELSDYSTTGIRVALGMSIKGAEKLKVVIPGEISNFTSECEVILPRGTAVRINKIYVNKQDWNMKRNTGFFETTIIAPDQINESNEEIYDGDALINEGVVKKLSFARFLKENFEEPEVEIPVQTATDVKTSVINDPALSAWLSLIDVDNLPEKFVK